MSGDDPTAYEAFINRWNGTLKIYQDMLDRKSSSGSSPSTDNPSQGGSTPTPSPEPGGDTPGGSGGDGGGTGPDGLDKD